MHILVINKNGCQLILPYGELIMLRELRNFLCQMYFKLS
jgi:hypothetical protein